ncbi:MAG: DinB family protein [Calditrichaeota bacterium]|nr:DinB family protein [Calditrichota bacterium]
MKKVVSVGLILLISAIAIQSFIPVTPVTDGYYKSQQRFWATTRSHTLEVAEAMPADKYNYQPTDTIRSFGAQMAHIAYSTRFLVDNFVMGKQVKFEDPDASKLSKAQIIKMLNDSFDKIGESMKKISDEQLNEMVEFPPGSGRKLTKADFFDFCRDHITNHRAKANLYIRMVGIKPPAYKF